jgi:F-type H+-transporting ATPase subunit alpha
MNLAISIYQSPFIIYLDPITKERLEKGRRLSEVLTQGKGVPLPFEKQVVVIYAGVNGYFDRTEVLEVKETEEKLFAYLESSHAKLFTTIKETREISETTEKELKTALQTFFDARVK